MDSKTGFNSKMLTLEVLVRIHLGSLTACLNGWNYIRKNLNFLRFMYVFDLVLNFCSVLNERNWLQLLFYFIMLMGVVALVYGMSFFIYVPGFSSKFSRNAVSWKRLQLESKTDLTTTAFFWRFLWNKPRFVDFISAWTQNCINCSVFILF